MIARATTIPQIRASSFFFMDSIAKLAEIPDTLGDGNHSGMFQFAANLLRGGAFEGDMDDSFEVHGLVVLGGRRELPLGKCGDGVGVELLV